MSSKLRRTKEEALVRRAQNLDESALSALFNVYYPKIVGYALTHLRDACAAEDLASDVMLQMVGSLHTYRFKGPPFSAWLFRIAHNKLIDLLRRDNRLRRATVSDLVAETGRNTPHEIVEHRLDCAEVRRAVGNLTPDQGRVIALRYFTELDTAGTAISLGRSRSAVKSLHHRALKSLRRVTSSSNAPVGI
jgi:RNA polymerase sigma-70 factor (ECF subfamily)